MLVWEKIPGEVDLYELILLNCIRYSEPDFFDFIASNIGEMRRGIASSKGAGSDVVKHYLLISEKNLKTKLMSSIVDKIFFCHNRSGPPFFVFPFDPYPKIVIGLDIRERAGAYRGGRARLRGHWTTPALSL